MIHVSSTSKGPAQHQDANGGAVSGKRRKTAIRLSTAAWIQSFHYLLTSWQKIFRAYTTMRIKDSTRSIVQNAATLPIL
jgi:hypothetical protein